MVSTRKNARSRAHVEIQKVERFQDEGRKERRVPSNYATRRTRVLVYFYMP